MMETRREFYRNHKYKIAALAVSIFCLTCLSLCAEEMSTARAKVCRENLVTEAKKYVGSPYTYGAIGPDSFDCSGLIYYCAREANKTQLPRTAKALYSYSRVVSDKDKEPGDLLFFATTSSGNVSHVGIYIGNNQFISAVSDGPNTGVILSSLKEAYWKPRYIGAGQIYKSGKMEEKHEIYAEDSDDFEGSSSTGTSAKSDVAFLDSLLFDASLMADWSLLRSDSFMINFRGIDLQSNARVSKWPLEPGMGLSMRYNHALKCFQIPLTLSVTLNDYLRVYLGPVFTFGSAQRRDSGDAVSPSVFPGTIGITFSTPSLTKDKVKVQIVQDISYSVCNARDGAALSLYQSLSTGLVFNTGVRVTVPSTLFMKGL